MGDYVLSCLAAKDLEAIADYTIGRFGVDRARQYRDDLKDCFVLLATFPLSGRRAEHLATGLRRFEHLSHIVFYLPGKDHVLVVRILHSRMDVARHI